jgi:hypothetical protein
MMPKSCVLCQFYTPDMTNPTLGVCRKHPPTVYPMANGAVTIWPSVKQTDWCGEGQAGMSSDSVLAGKQAMHGNIPVNKN